MYIVKYNNDNIGKSISLLNGIKLVQKYIRDILGNDDGYYSCKYTKNGLDVYTLFGDFEIKKVSD